MLRCDQGGAGSPTPYQRQIARAYARALQQLPVLGRCLRQEDFTRAIERSVNKRFHGVEPDSGAVAKYIDSLHADELGLAVACAAGQDAPWEHFITTYRPVLYRAARALTGDEATARELADALWAELYGVGGTRASLEAGTERRSLLDYFHGRSQLSTWLRSVLAQRHVDLVRTHRRTEPLDPLGNDDGEGERRPAGRRTPVAETETVDLDRSRYVTIFQQVLRAAVASLDPQDRLRLSCYYAQDLTLAETGQVLDEHEATVSRRLSKVRRALRTEIERMLTNDHSLTSAEVELCYRYATEESAVDLGMLSAQDSQSRPFQK